MSSAGDLGQKNALQLNMFGAAAKSSFCEIVVFCCSSSMLDRRGEIGIKCCGKQLN